MMEKIPKDVRDAMAIIKHFCVMQGGDFSPRCETCPLFYYDQWDEDSIGCRITTAAPRYWDCDDGKHKEDEE